jgi:putative membrane protein
MLSGEEQERVSAAIAAAERTTSGEIVAVIAVESDTYSYVPLLWAGVIAMIVPWPFIFLTWMPVQIVYAIQLAVFLAVALAVWTRPLRYALVPRAVKHARAHRRAVEQFLAQNPHTTAGRTGVLIFVSAAERYAEVLADIEIYEKVAKERWQGIVDRLIAAMREDRPADGFIEAIEASGLLLAEHFPPGSADPDELPNHLIVLE